MSARVQTPSASTDGEVREELERTQSELTRERRKSAELQAALTEQTALASKWAERALKGRPSRLPGALVLSGGVILGGALSWVERGLSEPAMRVLVGGLLFLALAGGVALFGRWGLGMLFGAGRATPPTPPDVADASPGSTPRDLTRPR